MCCLLLCDNLIFVKRIKFGWQTKTQCITTFYSMNLVVFSSASQLQVVKLKKVVVF